ncbi:MAG: hypothetical protein WAW75_05875 [Gallionella sp.]
MFRSSIIVIFLTMGLFLATCKNTEAIEIPESVIFTLYTNAPSDPTFRTKIATFDYYVGKDFEEVDAAINQRRCGEAAILFQWKWKQDTKDVASSPGVNKVRHWCEKGRFKK